MEISATIITVEAALALVCTVLEGVCATGDTQGRRIVSLEHDLSDYSDRIVALEKTVTQLSSKYQKLTDKTEDLESRSCRCNLQVVGIPEKLEGGDPVKMWDFLQEVLGLDVVASPPQLDRAHRLSPAGEHTNPKPRVCIVPFYDYRDKECILHRGRDQLHFRARNVLIFLDLSSSVAKKRAKFLSVKRNLHERKVTFSLRFPARLHVDCAEKLLLKHTLDLLSVDILFCQPACIA